MMRRFLKFSILFALPILIGAVTLEYTIRQIPNPYRQKYEWMDRHAEDVEVIILGSSHTFYGVKPNLFPQVTFNMANVSQEIEQDLWLLQHWAPHYRRLKTVVLTMSTCFWFNKGLENGDEAFRCSNYKIYMHCDLYSNFSRYNLEIAQWPTAKEKLCKALPLYFSTNNFGDDPNALSSLAGCDQYGWGNIFLLKNKNMKEWNDETEAVNSARRHTPENWNYTSKNLSKMKELAQFCQEHDVQLVLITTPCWPSYYNRISTQQLSKMYQLVDSLQREFNVPYFNYMKDTRFLEDDFYDSNHLSEIGAAKFTKILIKDLQNSTKNN